MKHSILVLDDEAERHALLAKLIGNNFDSVYTGEALLSEIERGNIKAETLFLDHDLGPNMDGTKLVNAIRDEKLEMPSVKRIFIHSNNVVKNTYMALSLQETYPDKIVKLAPTSWLVDMWNGFNHKKDELLTYLLAVK